MAIRRNPDPVASPTDIEWAKLAAYIDGEGCISIESGMRTSPNGKKYQTFILYVRITNTDFRLPLWCMRFFGGSVKFQNALHGTDRWPKAYWVVCASDAEHVLRGCLPYFVIKRDQAEIGIAFRETFASGGVKRWGPLPLELLNVRESMRGKLIELHAQPNQERAAVGE